MTDVNTAVSDAGASVRHDKAPPAAASPPPAAATAAKGGPVEGKKRIEEFPVRISLNITHNMAASLQRMHRRTRLKEAVIARLGLMDYLARQDPNYRED
jgi:hypothetical protein